MNALIHQSAASLARAIRERKVSSVEVVIAHLERIEVVNPKLNAVVQLTAEAALHQAREADASLARGENNGPLHGVPVTIKDNLDTAGIVSTGGTKGRASFVPERDATVVARLKNAGAILLGKTNTPELTMAYETANLIYGQTNNPFDLSRTCGGSSGGAAAIIAACGSPLDIGSDTGGSIRVPSHFCGTAGLKPTAGRVPKAGHILPLGSVVDAMTQIGPMARFVEDLALALPIIAGADSHDSSSVPMPLLDVENVDVKNLRVAFFTNNGIMPPTPEIADAVNAVAKTFSAAGARVDEAQPVCISQSFALTVELWTADGGAGFLDLLKASGTNEPHQFMQNVLAVCRGGEKSSADFARLLLRWERFRSEMLQFIESYDLILSPVAAFAALPHGRTFDNENFPGFSYTMTHNLTGWPAAVVRAGTSRKGLPIGVQLAARPWREDVALAAAKFVESSADEWPRPVI